MPPEETPAPAPAPAQAPAPAAIPESIPAPAPATAPESAPAPTPAEPVKYDLKLPEEGYFDPEVVNRVAEMAKRLNLKSEDAQGILDASVNEVTEFAKNMDAGMEAAKVEWAKYVASDKEIGGEALSQSKELAKAVLTKFGTEGLIKDLERTGLGNHPEMLRLLSRIGRSMKEDDFIAGGSNSGGNKNDMDAASRLYDNPSSKTL